MRQTVSEANKFLRQTVKSVEAGGVATLAQAMEHPGTLQEVHVTTLDAADAEIPAAAGLSEGVKLPTRIETKKLVIVGKFPVATQAEYDALSDAMKDKAVILDVTECPIGSEVKAIECNKLGNPIDAHLWIMGADGWKGGSSLTLTPGGTLVSSRTISAPNISTYPVITTPRSGLQRMRGDGVRVALHGSSTLANGSTYQILGGAQGVRNVTVCSLIWALNACGAEIDEVWNGAVTGSNSSGIHTRLLADWGIIKDLYDVHIYAPAFNDINNTTDLVSVMATYCVPDVVKISSYGKRVIWLTAFVPNPSSVTVAGGPARYAQWDAMVKAKAVELSAYPGQIMVWSLYDIFNPGGIDTPSIYMGSVSSGPQQYLNSVGTLYAASHPASRDIVRALQIPRTEADTSVYGTPVAQLDMTTATQSSATITSVAPDPNTGEPRWTIASAGALSFIQSAAVALNTAKVYRIVGEYELIANATARVFYTDGIKLEAAVTQRIGIYTHPSGGLSDYLDRPLGIVKIFGPKFTPSQTNPILKIYPGDVNSVVRVTGRYPLRIYEVPA